MSKSDNFFFFVQTLLKSQSLFVVMNVSNSVLTVIFSLVECVWSSVCVLLAHIYISMNALQWSPIATGLTLTSPKGHLCRQDAAAGLHTVF